MKKLLLLGAFAALFIACDKNEMNEDVQQELTIENTVQLPDEIGFDAAEIADILNSMDQPKKDASASREGYGFANWYRQNGDIITDVGTFGPPEYGVFQNLGPHNGFSNSELGNIRRWWSRRSGRYTHTWVANVDGRQVLRMKNNIIPNRDNKNYYNQRTRNEITSKFLHTRDSINGKRLASAFSFIVPVAGKVSAAIWQGKIEGVGNGRGESEGGIESFAGLDNGNRLDIRFRTGHGGVYGVFDAGLANPLKPKSVQTPLVTGNQVLVYISQKLDNGTGDTGHINVLVMDITSRTILRNTRRVGKNLIWRNKYTRASLRNGLYARNGGRKHQLDFVYIAHYWDNN